ncbi:MAG: UDP-N-acetylmuramoyl-L-alanyl-D-glutamate--2,6-diaminopimelate ligase [Acidimicrobiia bacterium]
MPGSTLGEVSRRVGGQVVGDPDTWLDDVTHDSRRAGPAVLFVAVRGARHDGHDYVRPAAAAGSPAAAVETLQDVEVSQVVVDDTRAAMGPMAAQVHGDPSSHIAVVGVTGTNGKTTVTHYVESLLTSAGRVAGLIGTVRTRVGTTVIPTRHTTPEATDFQRLLAVMRDKGAEVVAAEISSHALEMGRVTATSFAVGAFTNLSQDHLDFHGTMESYRHAKERFFREYEVGTAVINVGDPVGAAIAEWVETPLIRVGTGGEVRAENVETSFHGTTFELTTEQGTMPVRSGLVGAFNVENALVAVGCCLALGLEADEIVRGLGELEGVPGRFEQVAGHGPVHVIVDYAHTPGGIEQAIAVARSVGAGRVIAVVGAGGDRDRDKRPLMGRAAAEADLAILTTDNPRSEDPDQILREVAVGSAGSGVILEVDRHRAIERAIELADEGDVVLILGKGHETGQEIGGRVLPFDDREVARGILGRRSGSAGPGPGSGRMSP